MADDDIIVEEDAADTGAESYICKYFADISSLKMLFCSM